jgi:hypothetical protein
VVRYTPRQLDEEDDAKDKVQCGGPRVWWASRPLGYETGLGLSVGSQTEAEATCLIYGCASVNEGERGQKLMRGEKF